MPEKSKAAKARKARAAGTVTAPQLKAARAKKAQAAGTVTASQLKAARADGAGYAALMTSLGKMPASALRALGVAAGMLDEPTKTRRGHIKAPSAAASLAAIKKKIQAVTEKEAETEVETEKGAGSPSPEASPPSTPEVSKKKRRAAGGGEAGAEDGFAETPQTVRKQAWNPATHTAWPTLKGMHKDRVVDRPFAALLGGLVEDGCDETRLVQVVEGLRGAFLSPMVEEDDEGEGFVQYTLKVSDLALFSQGEGNDAVMLAATLPGDKTRESVVRSMRDDLVARTNKALEVVPWNEYVLAFNALFRAATLQVFPAAELKQMAKNHIQMQVAKTQAAAALAGAAASAPAAGSAAAVDAGSDNFSELYAMMIKNAINKEEVTVEKSRIVGAKDAKKLYASLKREPAEYPREREQAFTVMKPLQDELGRETARPKGLTILGANGAKDEAYAELLCLETEAQKASVVVKCEQMKAKLNTVYVILGDRTEKGKRVLSPKALDAAKTAVENYAREVSKPAEFELEVKLAENRVVELMDEQSLSIGAALEAGFVTYLKKRTTKLVVERTINGGELKRQQGAGGGGGRVAAGARGAGSKATGPPAGQAAFKWYHVRLAGGAGPTFPKCQHDKHDPNKGGDPKAVCGRDHSHWGASPDPAALAAELEKAAAHNAKAPPQMAGTKRKHRRP